MHFRPEMVSNAWLSSVFAAAVRALTASWEVAKCSSCPAANSTPRCIEKLRNMKKWISCEKNTFSTPPPATTATPCVPPTATTATAAFMSSAESAAACGSAAGFPARTPGVGFRARTASKAAFFARRRLTREAGASAARSCPPPPPPALTPASPPNPRITPPPPTCGALPRGIAGPTARPPPA